MARLIFGVPTFVLLVIFSSLSTFIVAHIPLQSQFPPQLREIVNNVAQTIQGNLQPPSFSVGNVPSQPTHGTLSPAPPKQGTLSPATPTPTPPPQPTLKRVFRNATNLHKPPRRKRGAMAREFLFEHNKIRAQLGEMPLKWDKKLARFAERFANKRKGDCVLMHSNTTIYGENVYRGEHYERHTAAMAVRAWANESQFYHPLTNSCQPDQMCGHYTQIIWRNTKRVGCSRMKCNNGGVYIICDYDPPGNYRNESPFTTPLSDD